MKTKFSKNFKRSRSGFSFIDAIIASTVLLITIIGSMSYRYHSKLDERKAKMQSSAAQIAVTLYEAWRGVHGGPAYNPTDYTWSDMTIAAGAGPEHPEDFTKLNSYSVTTNDFDYTATLSWQNVAGSPGLRALNVIVEWPTSGSGENDNTFTLTSYTTY